VADPKKYRDQAERLRKEADEITDPVQKRITRKLAELYDSLALHTEQGREGPTKH
jgi:hypothetical protein